MTPRFTLYRFFDHRDVLLYVGISADPPSRWLGHRRDKSWWRDIASITLEHFDSRALLEAAEREAIRAEDPLYNIQHARRHLGTQPAADPELADEGPSWVQMARARGLTLDKNSFALCGSETNPKVEMYTGGWQVTGSAFYPSRVIVPVSQERWLELCSQVAA